MIICSKEKCTGCFACMNKCPKDAISIDIDELGKTVPVINLKKCVECGVCKRICPVNNPVEKYEPKKIYAAWSKQEKDIRLSSSGGAASVFARRVIADGGKVFGAACIDANIAHVKIEKEEDIEKIRGSKYVQSNIGLTYRAVENDLIDKKTVLYTGTPCQIAGLRKYLGKEYVDLYTVDLICHGTPPTAYLKEHLDTVLKNHKCWDHLAFRGEYNYILTVYHGNKILYKQPSELDTYFRAFLDGLICRDNCYKCIYANKNRVGDITVADFWGIDRNIMEHHYDGRISLILINSKKGDKLFERIRNELVWEEHSLAEAMSPEQTNIHHPTVPHKDRGLFETIYKNKGFEAAIKATQVGKNIQRLRIRRFLKGFLRI